jgi:hypothetical protein
MKYIVILTMKQHTKERLNNILQGINESSGLIEFELERESSSEEQREITNYIGFALATKGLVYWPVRRIATITIGYRPYKYDIDTSLLGSICH